MNATDIKRNSWICRAVLRALKDLGRVLVVPSSGFYLPSLSLVPHEPKPSSNPTLLFPQE